MNPILLKYIILKT